VPAIIIEFPVRPAIRVERERGGDGWLALTPRGHAWVHSDFAGALADANEVAAGFGAVVRSSAA
jgi:hypothetical protein